MNKCTKGSLALLAAVALGAPAGVSAETVVTHDTGGQLIADQLVEGPCVTTDLFVTGIEDDFRVSGSGKSTPADRVFFSITTFDQCTGAFTEGFTTVDLSPPNTVTFAANGRSASIDATFPVDICDPDGTSCVTSSVHVALALTASGGSDIVTTIERQLSADGSRIFNRSKGATVDATVTGTVFVDASAFSFTGTTGDIVTNASSGFVFFHP